MKIISLHLSAFGKFKDKSLSFTDGLNVIEGLNESGKSTVHAFIEGMFYGFVKPGQKRRTFDEKLKRYQPKDTDRYYGSMVFEHAQTRYRLERDFHQRKGTVKLYNDKTGQELTGEYDVDPITKQIDVGAITDMPYALYVNTLSIGELDKKPTDTAEDTLVERLQNLSATASETLSTNKALAHLENTINAIGTDRAKTKPYAQTQDALTALETEKNAALEHHAMTLRLKTDLDKEKTALEEQKEKAIALNTTVDHQKNTKRIQTHQAIEKLWLVAKTALDEHSLEPVNLTPTFWFDTFDHHSALFDNLEEMRDVILSHQQKIDTLSEQIDEENATLSERKFKEIAADKNRLETYKNQLDDDKLTALKQAATQFEKEKTTVEARLRRTQKSLRITLPVMSVIFVMMAVLTTLFIDHPAAPFSFFIMIIPLFALTHGVLKYRKLIARLRIEEGKAVSVKKSLERQTKTHEQAQKEIDRRLSDYTLKTMDEFTEFYYEAKAKFESKQRLDNWVDRVEKEKEKRANAFSKLHPLLNRFNLPKEPASLAVLMKLKTIHRDILALLAGRSYEAFVQSFDTTRPWVDPSTQAENTRQLETLNQSIQQKERQIGEEEARLKEKAKAVRDLSLIEHDIARAENSLSVLQAKRLRAETAIKLILKATDQLEENFAPVLSENIEALLPTLTNENYHEIKIRRTLDFTVKAPQTGTLEAPLFFSKGTLDQIYFAVRIGILKTLDKTSMPLFLDDAFVNFDDERLRAALQILTRLSSQQQIVIFTCQTREKTLLEKDNVPTNALRL